MTHEVNNKPAGESGDPLLSTEEAIKQCMASFGDLRVEVDLKNFDRLSDEELTKMQVYAVKKALIELGADCDSVQSDILPRSPEKVQLVHFEKYQRLFKHKNRPDSVNEWALNASETDTIGTSGFLLKYYPSRGGEVKINKPTFSLEHLADFVAEIRGKDTYRKNLKDLLLYFGQH